SDYVPLEQALERSAVAREYLLRNRGITHDTASKLHLGYRRDVGHLAGKVGADVAGKGWLAFPCILDGRVVSVKYRSIVEKAFCRQPGMATALFNLPTVDPLAPVYITEGEFDAAILEQAGFHAVSIPSASVKLTAEMKDQLLEAETVILAGDNDAGVGSAAMQKLWSEMERTFLLKWPDGLKDANDVFLKKCGGDVSVFRTLVNDLTAQSKTQPMANVYSLQQAMENSNWTGLLDHPKRMKWPWPSVDKMAILLPGAICSIFATNTGMGKTTLIMNAEIEEARRGEVVLNYSAELNPDEYANLVAAYLLRKDKLQVTRADMKEAAKRFGNARYYIGHNPDANTVTPVLDLIEAGIRRLGATRVVLDHLHFVCLNEKNPIEAEANAMQRIKNIATKYGIIFFVLGQPRKANQQNKGKVVHITDAKGSEAFTSMANAVIALHRNEAKVVDPANPPKDPYEPETQVILKKGRSLAGGNSFAKLELKGNIGTFFEITNQEPPPNLPRGQGALA
ncbi:MAG: hypothetical protein JWQ87_2047, partial [Candidatus Sulfotelmatobacter sp.]|nr:hypothetical protein [Candidatus Sulfotelmatobacter sp.]